MIPIICCRFSLPLYVRACLIILGLCALPASAIAQSVQELNFGDVLSYSTAGGAINNPQLRYSVKTDPKNGLVLTQSQVAVMTTGVRTQLEMKGGRAYSAEFSFTPTGFDSNSGVVVGFDPSEAVGNFSSLGNEAVLWSWRSNGAVTTYSIPADFSLAERPNGEFSFTSGLAQTFAVKDVLRIDLIVDSTLTMTAVNFYKNNNPVFSGTVAKVPRGYFFAGLRLVGPQTAVIRKITARDRPLAGPQPIADAPAQLPAAAPAKPEAVAAKPDISILKSPQPPAAPEPAVPVRPVEKQPDDPFARSLRKPPPGMPALPSYPNIVHGPGNVEMTQDFTSAFYAKYKPYLSAGVAYVEQNGNDATAELNSREHAFASICKPLRDTKASLIEVGAGTFQPCDYRISDPAGGKPKLVYAAKPDSAIIRVTGGDDLAKAVWKAVPGKPGLYQTEILAAKTGPGYSVDRVLLKDTKDRQGFPQRLQKYPNAPELMAARTGWSYDASQHLLYVAMAGADIQQNRHRLLALYLDAVGNSRFYLLGATLALEGFYLDDVQTVTSEFVDGKKHVASELWLKDITEVFSPVAAYANQNDGSSVFAQNVRVHASGSDAFNANSSPTSSSLIFVTGSHITDPGDVMTQGTAIFPNNNCVSSHQGFAAVFGTYCSGSGGPGIADTASEGFASASWYVGDIIADNDSRQETPVGFGFYGTDKKPPSWGQRFFWLDTVRSERNGSNALRVEAGAIGKIFNSKFDQPPILYSSPALGAYTPEAP